VESEKDCRESRKILKIIGIQLKLRKLKFQNLQIKSNFHYFNTIFNFPHRCLVSKLFDVCPRSTMAEMDEREEVRVTWGTGIAGYVAESGDPVNIPDAYQVSIVQ
jgi:hypothetical protein